MAMLIAFAALCIFLFFLRNIRSRKPSLPLPPGPRGYPLLGALPLIGSAAHVSLARLAERYGPIMYLKMGTCGVVVVSASSAARVFFTALDLQFANRPTNMISTNDMTYQHSDLVFSTYGPQFTFFRRVITHDMIGGKALADWALARRSEVCHMLHSMLDSSKRGEPAVMPKLILDATTNILGRILLSRRLLDPQNPELEEFNTLLMEHIFGAAEFNIGDFVPAISWMDYKGVLAKKRRLHERLDKMLRRMLAEHEASARERESKPDFLDFLLQMRDSCKVDGKPFSDTNIKSLLVNLLVAATDAPSVVLDWSFAEMLKNPKILKRLQAELDGVIGRDRTMEESDIPKLPYLQAVCKEVLRLHPATPLGVPHFTIEPCKVEGYRIPANTRLLVNMWAIGRDPNVWERPLVFDPERFLAGKMAAVEPHGTDFELIPFGAGRRMCAGKKMGLAFLQYFLGTLVHAFDWAMPEGEEVDMAETPGLVMRKTVQLKVLVTPRLAPNAYDVPY